MHIQFAKFLRLRYAAVRAQFPGEGQRKWTLRVVDEFWAAGDAVEAQVSGIDSTELPEEYEADVDPIDERLVGDGPQLGLLIRTDFSDDEAWSAFRQRLEAEERDFIASVPPDDVQMQDGDAEEGEDSGDDSDDEPSGIQAPIIKVIDPQSEQDRALLRDISNLRALHLFNDVGVRSAPSPPADTPRVSPPHRLVDRRGMQECYTGPNLWVYDAQSNSDQSARQIRQESDDLYGTATGDSWRARVTHLIELQSEMVLSEMNISFGGLDRWDYSERRRNLVEAEPSQYS